MAATTTALDGGTGDVRRVVAVAAAAVLIIGALAWLVAGIDEPVAYERRVAASGRVAAARPTATIARCGVLARPDGPPLAGATVALANPTGRPVRAHVAVNFGDVLGIGDAAVVRLAPGDSRLVSVPAPTRPLPASFDCVADVSFSDG